MQSIVDDWNKVLNNEISVDEYVSLHWEKFRPVYIKTFGVKDDGDLYLKVYTCITKMKKCDVQPVFQFPEKLLAYFKKFLQIESYIDYNKHPLEESLNQLEEDLNLVVSDDIDYFIGIENSMVMDELFKKLKTRLSENQLKSVLLMVKYNYSAKEVCQKLGIYRWTLEDRLNRAKPIIKDVLKNFK